MDHEFFMNKALEQAAAALQRGEFPVGCVMAYRSKVLVTGARSRSGPQRQNELDHAEMSALRRLVDLDRPVERGKVVVYSTLEPCLMCYSALIVNGLQKIVYAYEDVFGGGTDVDLTALRPFYRDRAVEITPGVLRDKSRALFNRFFSDPKNNYLKDTPLAQHALAGPS
ncbi:MAG: nucleoside deaminase [Deltaproteobacteria bacterium]|nr:nucleoside deaminase [Deltaproteobacteria bacterium]